MSKLNRAQRRELARKKFSARDTQAVTSQAVLQTLDHSNGMVQMAAILAMHRVFGFGQERLYRMCREMIKISDEALCYSELRDQVETEIPGLLERTLDAKI